MSVISHPSAWNTSSNLPLLNASDLVRHRSRKKSFELKVKTMRSPNKRPSQLLQVLACSRLSVSRGRTKNRVSEENEEGRPRPPRLSPLIVFFFFARPPSLALDYLRPWNTLSKSQNYCHEKYCKYAPYFRASSCTVAFPMSVLLSFFRPARLGCIWFLDSFPRYSNDTANSSPCVCVFLCAVK